MFNKQTVEVHLKGKPVKVHLVSTGAVSVKTKFRESTKTGILASLDFIFDKKFTEWMPIWVMVIEHPEGVFVIDTGEQAEVNDPGFFKSSGFFVNWFDTTQFKFIVKKEEEIGPQLSELNIPVEKIKAVVLTHLHLDHIDGLKYFPSTEIIVNKYEWEKPYGDLPKLYPAWFAPTLVELNEQYENFEKASYLTKAKDLLMLHTPGHTYGHCSVVFNTDEGYLFFGADVCYAQRQLIERKYSGTNASHRLAEKTYAAVTSFAKQHKTIFIPSHETAAAERLQTFEPVF